jgi:signal recognition particle receptor subunit beta
MTQPMVLFNYSTKELTAKVVYYGPGLCGKTTNLQWVHEKLPIKNKGKMLSLATETDRTLFFDFLPIEIGTIRGMRTRIQLYTVPGQVFYNATRRMVLKGADAVVFVCDSQEAMLDANVESFQNMRQNLEANEIDPDEIPLVLQYNKRDLPNALPIEILNERMNPRENPWQEAVALKGIGVEETLKAVTKLVFKSLSARYGEGGVPVRQSSPPRPPSSPPLAPPSSPPLAPAPPAGADDLLRELASPASFPPGPSRMTQLPQPGSLPPIEIDPTPPPREPVRPAAPSEPPRPAAPKSTAQAPRPAAPASRPPTPPAPAGARPTSLDVPTRPPVPPEPPPRPPLGAHPPQRTLVTKRDEAEDLRRRIAAPGIAEDVDMELEEIEELETVPEPARAPAQRPAPRPASLPPAPTLEPEPETEAEASEVEVPIDIEVAPGTTRLTLNLKLVLSFKRR